MKNDEDDCGAVYSCERSKGHALRETSLCCARRSQNGAESVVLVRHRYHGTAKYIRKRENRLRNQNG